jgi:capsular polysaccharide transport system permease protein
LLADYQKLTLDQEFASKTYEISLQSLHNAQTVASLRQKFVAVIVSPNLPEGAAWPDAARVIPLTLIGSIFAYLVGSLVFSVLRDNQGS